MGWALLVISLASFAYTWYKTRQATVAAQQMQQITGPTAAEGIAIPVLFGSRVLTSPNVCWYGNQLSTRNEDGTITYKIGLQLALCHGKLDQLTQIYLSESDAGYLREPVMFDTRVLLSSADRAITSGASFVMTYVLEGHAEIRLGAINTAGTVDPGDDDSWSFRVNAAMGLVHGPKYYGIAMVEGVQFDLGTSPQLPGWAFFAQRIHTRKGGSATQWYDAKAAITLGRNREGTWKYLLVDGSDVTDYSGTSYDDSAWPSGRGGIGNAPIDKLMWQFITDTSSKYPVPVVKTRLLPADYPTLVFGGAGTPARVAVGAKLWIRGDLGPLPAQDLGVQCWHDDSGFLWFNGTVVDLVPTVDAANPELQHFNSTATIPAALVNPSGPNVIAYRVRDSFSADGTVRIGTNQYIYGGVQVGLDVSNPSETVDMNPIHIVQEVLTDNIWGAGYADGLIGDSFATAADTCFSENIGLSLVWNEQTSYLEFIADILRYVSGVLYIDQTTGKFEIDLIREDYIFDDLLVLDGTNTTTINDTERQSVGQLVNSVTSLYSVTPRGKQGSATVFEQGLITSQGGLVSQKIDYPAVSTSFTAGRLALRDLRVLSAPLLSCTVGANREAMALRPGSPFVLNRPDLGIENTVMRVSEIDIGDGITNEVTIKCVEDVFYFPSAPTVASNPPVISPPPTVKIVTATDEYLTAYVSDARDKGWVETAFHGAAWGAGTVFSGWELLADGSIQRTVLGPLTAGMFDGINPFTGVAGSGTGTGESWAVGRCVFALSQLSDLTQKELQGPYVVDDIGGHWENYGEPEQAFVQTYARMHRDPSFNTSASFVKDMIFSVRAGTSFGEHFLQLATENVVLGTTAQAWTDIAAGGVTWTETYELLKRAQLSERNVSPDSYHLLSATMVNGTADIGGFETLIGTPNTPAIPAGTWYFYPSYGAVTGASSGSTTMLGLKVYAAGTNQLLFEVLSEPITSSTAVAIPSILYQASTIAIAVTDRLVLIPSIHTTSSTPATLSIYYNANNAIRVMIPQATPTGSVSVVDEGFFPVTIDANGVISGFGSHRNLLVSGAGPLKGIASDGLSGGVALKLTFRDAATIAANTVVVGAVSILTTKNNVGMYQGMVAPANSVLTFGLRTDAGTTAFWQYSGGSNR